jgi:Zn-dependent protease with chaperone function
MTELFRAGWFDGRSSRAREVLVRLSPGLEGPMLGLQPADAPELVLRHDQVVWPESWSAKRTPRKLVVDLREHGSLEIENPAAWHAALEAAGHAAPLAQRMQTRWGVFLGVLVVAAAALAAFYRWGTPWTATQLTRQVPLSWETGLSDRALADLDAGFLKPSKLPQARQEELLARFYVLVRRIPPELQRYAGYAPRYSLRFRSGLGANAFALPGGAIVMTDDMVEAAAKQGLSDDALVGVLAHEIGHVVHRHTTRMLVEQAVLNAGLAVALGDISSVLSMGASALTGMAYSRGHETEADCFAVGVMRSTSLPTAPMADLLLGIEAQASGAKEHSAPEPGWMQLLSSHPETGERAQQLKRGQTGGCR